MKIERKKMITVWKCMKQRCFNPKDNHFKYYGARGISVCEKWISFKGFYEDMRDGYKIGLTLDRIDNNKGYSKDNCRWVTMRVQNSNKRWNHWVTFNGITKTINQWAEYLGIKRSTLSMRFHYGWNIEKCLTFRRVM